MRVHTLQLWFLIILLRSLWNHQHKEGQFNLDSTTNTLAFWEVCCETSLFLLLPYGAVLESKYFLKRELLNNQIHTSALLILSSLYCAASVPATIVTGPMPINITHCNDTISLTCVANAESLSFFINGVNADQGVPNFQQSAIVSIGSNIIRTLIAMVTDAIDGASIVCRAFNILSDPSEQFSEPPVLIRVQGALDPPTEIMFNTVSSTSVNISWIPPSTLIGTTIKGYNVSSSTGDSVFTNENFVILSNISNSSNCNPINITVTPCNCRNNTEDSAMTSIYQFYSSTCGVSEVPVLMKTMATSTTRQTSTIAAGTTTAAISRSSSSLTTPISTSVLMETMQSPTLTTEEEKDDGNTANINAAGSIAGIVIGILVVIIIGVLTICIGIYIKQNSEKLKKCFNVQGSWRPAAA